MAPMKEALRPDIFGYQDFRKFLADTFSHLRRLDSKFTKSYVCRGLGLIQSRSYFQDILNGKFLSKPKVEDFIRVFGLSKREAGYFRLLVNFDQATDSPDERELFFEKLLAHNKTPQRLVSQAEYSYYKQWYNPVVRAILNIHDITDEYSALGNIVFPAITAGEAEQAIRLLAGLKLIHRNTQGFWKPTEKVLTTGPLVKEEVIRQYQSKRLQEAQRAFLKGTKYPHRFITRTLSVSEPCFQAVIGKMQSFSAELTAIIHSDGKPADRVYQLDLLLYPCSIPGKSR